MMGNRLARANGKRGGESTAAMHRRASIVFIMGSSPKSLKAGDSEWHGTFRHYDEWHSCRTSRSGQQPLRRRLRLTGSCTPTQPSVAPARASSAASVGEGP